MRVRGVLFVLGMSLVGSSLQLAPSASAEPGGDGTLAPLHRTGRPSELPGRYIVVMDPRSSRSDHAAAQRQAATHGGRVSATYRAALTGFAASLPARAVEVLRRNPRVDFVEADAELHASGTQSGAPWGLDRTDQRELPLDASYRYEHTGAGVTAYIIDSGIRKTHKQFGGRVAGGFTSIRDGRGTDDCSGHGTHVAGIVGAKRYGVAKGVTLRPVRILNCRGGGTRSGAIAGLDWVTAHHAAGSPAVANMSVGGDPSSAVDRAVRNSILDGVTYVIAAGNDGVDACGYSPARVGDALTVGATTKSDARPAWSNTGSCLDLFAPGSGITSAWKTSNTATKTISGTSMAAPHVAGAAALLLEQLPTAAPDLLAQTLLQSTTADAVDNRGSGSSNRLLYAPVSIGAPLPVGTNLLINAGFEDGSFGWTASPGVITDDPGAPAHQGSWKAWLGGYGEAGTDTLAQALTIPAASTARLSFFLRIDTEESPDDVYDELQVSVKSGGVVTTLATYSNLDAGADYVERSYGLSAFTGKTVTLQLAGTEDDFNATSFVADDFVLTAS